MFLRNSREIALQFPLSLEIKFSGKWKSLVQIWERRKEDGASKEWNKSI
jgi:hypothetical protein